MLFWFWSLFFMWHLLPNCPEGRKCYDLDRSFFTDIKTRLPLLHHIWHSTNSLFPSQSFIPSDVVILKKFPNFLNWLLHDSFTDLLFLSTGFSSQVITGLKSVPSEVVIWILHSLSNAVWGITSEPTAWRRGMSLVLAGLICSPLGILKGSRLSNDKRGSFWGFCFLFFFFFFLTMHISCFSFWHHDMYRLESTPSLLKFRGLRRNWGLSLYNSFHLVWSNACSCVCRFICISWAEKQEVNIHLIPQTMQINSLCGKQTRTFLFERIQR